MGKLMVLAEGDSRQSQANSRGKLFEKLMASIIGHSGFLVDKWTPNVNYSGMEIDIEGHHKISQVQLIAECKFYNEDIKSPQLSEFFGKYFAKWLKDKHCQGIFIAIPGINSHAKGFYNDNIKNQDQITFHLLTEPDVINIMAELHCFSEPSHVQKIVIDEVGTLGDWHLAYTENGLFWIQNVIPKGSGIAQSVFICDAKGNHIFDAQSIEFLKRIHPELREFDIITRLDVPCVTPRNTIDDEQVVEVKGSSACFEYQFPASPQFFVGREQQIDEIESVLDKILEKQLASRGLIFEGNSGWGKSSLVLTCVERIRKKGHFAYAIDSRSASTSQFILRVIEHIFKNPEIQELMQGREDISITGYDGAITQIISLSKELERKNKLLVVFFDQFENIFFKTDTFTKIRNFYLKIEDIKGNIVVGFSWKSDLIGLTDEFPYKLRDDIKDTSRRFRLSLFSESEINAILEHLEKEIKRKLSSDLRYFLFEFSLGFPWLLKKLCAHVQKQIENGKTQRMIANGLLNIEELFKQDVDGLTPEEEEGLRRIAKVAPIGVQELGEEYKAEIVQSLVNARLIVRIGTKYDIYWDIFRDYLNSGKLPIQDNYLLRSLPGSLIKPIKILVGSKKEIDLNQLLAEGNYTERTFHNISKDLRLLGIAAISNGKIKLQIDIPDVTSIDRLLKPHVREKLQYNRIVNEIQHKLSKEGYLSLPDIAILLSSLAPYISASERTWETYAKTICSWLNFSEIAAYNIREQTLYSLSAVPESYRRKPVRITIVTPQTRYREIELISTILLDDPRKLIEEPPLSDKKVQRILRMMEQLGFVNRNHFDKNLRSPQPTPILIEFVEHPERRSEIFAVQAQRLESFSLFVEIMNSSPHHRIPIEKMATMLRKKLGANWSKVTSLWIGKMCVDWAKQSKLAPLCYLRINDEIVGQTKLTLLDSLNQE